MTYGDMQSRVQQLVQDTSGTQLANIQNWLNDGQQDFVSRRDWWWLLSSSTLTTTAGTETYSLDSDVHRVINVRNETDDKYILEMNRKLHQLGNPNVDTTNDRNSPDYWYAFGVDSDGDMQIKFYPVPDDTYTIRYDFYKRATDMSGSADKGVIPARYHKALVHYASQKYFEMQQDDMATYHATQYENEVLKALQDSDESDAQPMMLPAKNVQYRGNTLADDYFLRL